MNNKGKNQLSQKVNILMSLGKWKDVEKLVRNALRKEPSEYWLLTTLANSLYEQKKYKEALDLSQEAYKLNKNDPLVIYDLAPILKMNGYVNEAVSKWKLIERKSINELAFGKYGEGIKWAKGVKNNVYLHLALVYKEKGDMKKFKKYLLLNLNNRERGVFCSYPKKDVLRLYKKYFNDK